MTLEWTIGDGRTFQLSGARGIEGSWERFFHPNDHPTRSRATESQVIAVWASAVEPLVLYSVRKDEVSAEWLTRNQILDRVEEMFPGSVRRA